MYAKFIGVTAELASLIERRRANFGESECDILVRALSLEAHAELDLGQGARLNVGERLYLFLSAASKDARRPDGLAEVRIDGLAVDGVRVQESRGSWLQPAMQIWQRKRGDRNSEGHLTSRSAWRQWHVEREGKLVPIEELKDPRLARKRGRVAGADLTLAELGL